MFETATAAPSDRSHEEMRLRLQRGLRRALEPNLAGKPRYETIMG